MNWPGMQIPQPTPERIEWPNGAPTTPNVVTTYKNPAETTDEIREEFNITPPLIIPPNDYPPVA